MFETARRVGGAAYTKLEALAIRFGAEYATTTLVALV